MGGVDLSDMKRLFCETRYHCLRRWWIRIFVYYMDVSILNAAILYGLAAETDTPNMLEMKTHLIEYIWKTLVEKTDVSVPPPADSIIVQISVSARKRQQFALDAIWHLECAFHSALRKAETVG